MSELTNEQPERLAHIRRPSDIDRIPDLLVTIAALSAELDAANAKLAEAQAALERSVGTYSARSGPTVESVLIPHEVFERLK